MSCKDKLQSGLDQEVNVEKLTRLIIRSSKPMTSLDLML